MLSKVRMAERVFLTWLCVRTEKERPWGMAKRGALGGRGNLLVRQRRAATGHRGEEPKTGI